MDEQTMMKKQLRASFQGDKPDQTVETQYGVHYRANSISDTQKSLDKLTKYIPEINTLVQTIDDYEQ